MASRHDPIRIAADLATLPLPPEELWVRTAQPGTSLIAPVAVTAVALIAIAAVVLPLIARVDERPSAPSPAAPTGPSPTVPATTSPTLGPSALITPPACPLGQLPSFDITFPPPPGSVPGTGAASAEIAFRRLRPNATDFTLTYPFGSGPAAPAWIVAGNETFVAQILGTPGGNNWFAFPARFLGCT